MMTSTLVDHLSGRKIHAARVAGGRGRNWLLLSLVTNLGLLGYFKYANFGFDTLNEILAIAGSGGFNVAEIILPVGISFYTFQTLSYTIDIYRGKVEPVKRFGDFACYVAMFPQLVAGPIVRYSTVARQLFERTHTVDKFAAGVLAFESGLIKKVLLADLLAPTADLVFNGGAVTTFDAWLGSLAFSLQLYFDFSGYSDMAIGLGLMLGFRLPINFDRPYISQSITEFWRRWHISLSAWLRDYLYLPLGGNRKGSMRTYVNLALVMLIGGLWHGAAWTFLVWGAWHGVTHNWTRDQLREHGHIASKITEALDRLDLPTVNVNCVGKGLKGIERDTYGQNDLRNIESTTPGNRQDLVQCIEAKVRVLEVTQEPRIRNKRKQEPIAATASGNSSSVYFAATKMIHECGSHHQNQEVGAPPPIEHIACQS